MGYDRRRFTTDVQSLQGHKIGSSDRYWLTVSSIISGFCGPNFIDTVEARCKSGRHELLCGRLRLNVISHGRIGCVFCSSVRGVLENSHDLMQKNKFYFLRKHSKNLFVL